MPPETVEIALLKRSLEHRHHAGDSRAARDADDVSFRPGIECRLPQWSEQAQLQSLARPRENPFGNPPGWFPFDNEPDRSRLSHEVHHRISAKSCDVRSLHHHELTRLEIQRSVDVDLQQHDVARKQG